MEVGDIFYGFVAIGTDPGSPGDLAPQVAVRLERVSSAMFTSDPVLEAAVGVEYTYEAAGSDSEGDPVTITGVTVPDWLTVTDNGDGTATVSGTPEADDLGANPVVLEISNGEESETQEFTIVVSDTTPPVITLNGDADMVLPVGLAFNDPGATATDNVDGDISGDIVVTGTVDTSTPGTYTIDYDVMDAAGNPATTVTRTVRVVADDDDDNDIFGIGSTGLWSLLLMIPLFGIRRRRTGR
jgi:hypothetical protein